MNSNEKKTLILGMPHNKARHRLMKSIMFNLIQKLSLDICYRCNKKIEFLKDLSIDHKTAWLNSNNPKELYFDLNNIAYSHLRCNCLSSDRKKSEEQKQRLSYIMSGKNVVLPYNEVQEIRDKIQLGQGIRTIAREHNISHVHVLNIRDLKRRKDK